jgi:hypothetical protein
VFIFVSVLYHTIVAGSLPCTFVANAHLKYEDEMTKFVTHTAFTCGSVFYRRLVAMGKSSKDKRDIYYRLGKSDGKDQDLGRNPLCFLPALPY